MSAIIPSNRRWWREPLLWFLAAGFLIFWFNHRFNSDTRSFQIDITPAVIQRIQDQWQTQMGRPPGPDELQSLVDQWLREEVYYREALRLGLAANDTIVRRRLVQKLTFLTEDIATNSEPAEAELMRFFDAHADRYALAQRLSFQHRYFSSDRQDNAQQAANSALLKIEAGISPKKLGDAFMLQLAYSEQSEQEIARLFGNEFAASVMSLDPGQWSGPVQSAYGWHLVKVEAKLPAQQQPFSQVREQVLADYRFEQRKSANESMYDELRQHYQIVNSAAAGPSA